MESFLMVDNEVRNAGVVGLAISGNVEAISMVHHGDTADGMRQSLKQLRQSGIPCNKDSNTACFMVSCIGRGEKFYNAKNVETGIFRQEFPGIPVLGFFGNGELGLDLHSCEGKLERDGHFLHSYSSVFCLCSLLSQSNGNSTAVERPEKVSGGKEAQVSGGKEAQVSGGKEAQVSDGKEAQVSGGKEAQVSGGKKAQVSDGKEAQVSGGKEAQVSGGKEAQVSGGKEAQVSGGKEAQVSDGKEAQVSDGKELSYRQKKKFA